MLLGRLVELDGDDRAHGLAGAQKPLELGHDVVARRDAELERVLRREPQLVDGMEVPGIGDRDAEDVVVDRVRDGDRALERLDRDQLSGID